MIEGLMRRIQQVIRPGRSIAATNESGKIARAQLRYNDMEWGELNYMQHFGFLSTPPVGSDFMRASVSGDGANSTAVASNHQDYRPRSYSSGNTMLYNATTGVWIKLEGNVVTTNATTINVIGGSTVSVTAPSVNVTASTKVSITSPLVECSGTLKAANIEATNTLKGGGITFNTHRHAENGTGGGTTGTPFN